MAFNSRLGSISSKNIENGKDNSEDSFELTKNQKQPSDVRSFDFHQNIIYTNIA